MSSYQAILFILTFFIEVQAEQNLRLPPLIQPIQYPENCLEKSGECAFSAPLKVKASWTTDGHSVTVGDGGAMVIRNEKQFDFLQGNALIQTFSEKKEIRLSTGVLSLSSGAIVLLQRPKGSGVGIRTTITVYSGGVLFTPISSEPAFNIRPGTQMWIGGVNSDRKIEMGFPMTPMWKDAAQPLAQLWPSEKESYLEVLKEYRTVWKQSQNDLTQELQDYTQALVAKVQRRVAQAERDRKNIEKERKALQNLYFERTFDLSIRPGSKN